MDLDLDPGLGGVPIEGVHRRHLRSRRNRTDPQSVQHPSHSHRASSCEPLPNVIHLEATSDEEAKSRFIRTCDAMLHARYSGETFGLAVAEFSVHNRPVLTSSVHDDEGAARMHINTLGARGIFYHDYR